MVTAKVVSGVAFLFWFPRGSAENARISVVDQGLPASLLIRGFGRGFIETDRHRLKEAIPIRVDPRPRHSRHGS